MWEQVISFGQIEAYKPVTIELHRGDIRKIQSPFSKGETLPFPGLTGRLMEVYE